MADQPNQRHALIAPPRENRPLALPRRSFITGATALALVGACSSGSGDDNGQRDSRNPAGDAGQAGESEDFAAGGPDDDDRLLIQPAFSSGNRAPPTLVAGQRERAPFILWTALGTPAVNGLPKMLSATLTGPDGTTSNVELNRYDDGIPTPYFLLRFEPPDPGGYVLDVSMGPEMQRSEFRVAPSDEINLVRIGEPLRSVETPTFSDSLGYDPICTRFEPCPFHEQSLADVIGNGRPTALLIATPGFCRTEICGPSVELLMDIDPSASVDTIHAEVYTEPGRLAQVGSPDEITSPVVSTYGMIFEPSFVVADSNGIVTARLDYAFDRTEMAEAIGSTT